jgi:hypothetical protein
MIQLMVAEEDLDEAARLLRAADSNAVQPPLEDG